MNTQGWLWSFLGGIPGIRELALVAMVVLALYGRSGLQVVRRGGGGLPWWLLPVRRTSPSQSPPSARSRVRSPAPTANPEPAASSRSAWSGDRLFWFLAILAATAVGAWVVTRTLIVSAPRLSP